MALRSLVYLLFLASICLFKLANPHPHFDFGIERRPLPGSSGFTMQNGTQNFFERQDKNLCDSGRCDSPSTSVQKSSYVDPPGELRCEPPPPSKIYRDSHKHRVKEASKYFCEHWASAKYFDYNMAPIVKTVHVTNSPRSFRGIAFPSIVDDIEEWQDKNQNQDDVYDIRVEVVEGCEPNAADHDDHDNDDEKKLNQVKAIRHPTCKHLLTHAWKVCNNAGRGGSLQAGCLRYSIHTKF